MAWTTSAGPWANIAHMGEARTLTQAVTNALVSLKNNRSGLAIGAAVAHLALIALVVPSMADPGLGALLLASAGLLAAGVWLAFEAPSNSAALASCDMPSAMSFEAPAISTEINPPGAPANTEADTPAKHPVLLLPTEINLPAATLPPHLIGSRINAHNKDWADLMARVSHELRTPLNAVLGFSDVMDRGLFGPLGHHRYQEYARHIHDSGRDLLKSAEDTLAVTSLLAAPLQHRQTDVIELADLISEAWAFFGRTPANRSITLDVSCEPGTEITCDRRTTRQVLINLLSEALTRSGQGTVIRIETSCCGARVDVDITLSSQVEGTAREPGSLHVCLARTLLEFHGSHLHEFLGDDNAWRAVTRFDRAVQADFFLA